MTVPVPPADPTPPAPPVPDDAGRTFTQDDVSRVGAREHGAGVRVGKAQAAAELAEQLGVTVDEAKEIITAHRAAQDAAKTDVQRAQEAAARAQQDAAAQVAAARSEAHAARVEAALIGAGIALPDGGTPAKDEKRTATLTRAARLVDAEVGTDAASIAAAVTALKADMPGLFGSPAASAGGDPGPGPRARTSSGPSGLEAGRQAALAAAGAGRRASAKVVDGKLVYDYGA